MADEPKRYRITASAVMEDENGHTLDEYIAQAEEVMETAQAGDPLDPTRVYARWNRPRPVKRDRQRAGA
jgi:hypothetical protein